MQPISDINPQGVERPNPSQIEREKLQQQRLQREKEEGYQTLVELCDLGEYDMAQQLANRQFYWGYEIVDGMVMERKRID
ncbi:hypothetical protein [Microcoleus sp. S13C4]|uniref:hypothetical protein n=1 Tax=Microcoleus sp. S13C4 TaxID=3055410 RepID=UPI002FD08969